MFNKLAIVVLAAPLLLAAPVPPAKAATITQVIGPLTQTIGDFTPFDINGKPFNPALGTLLDVRLEIIGSYTPHLFHDIAPHQVTATVTSRLFAFAEGPNLSTHLINPLGVQGNVPVNPNGHVLGAATAVDRVFDFNTPAEIASFESANPATKLLAGYGFRASDALSCAGGCSDLTTYSGHAVLTYVYKPYFMLASFSQAAGVEDVATGAAAVPEPATVLTFATGLLGLAWSRSRAK